MCCWCRKDGDSDYMNILVTQIMTINPVSSCAVLHSAVNCSSAGVVGSVVSVVIMIMMVIYSFDYIHLSCAHQCPERSHDTY